LKQALGKEQVPEAGTREGLQMKTIEKKPEPEAVDELGGMVRKELDSIRTKVNEFIFKNKLAGKVKVETGERGAVITISDVILFPPGKTDINEGADTLLDKIADLLKQFDYHIKVEGHSDNQPIHNDLFPSNWELSANRASKIVRYFISKGLPPDRFSAEGFAEFRPIASNDTPEGRAKNRRVEIVYERSSIEKEMRKRLAAKKAAAGRMEVGSGISNRQPNQNVPE